MPDIAFLDIRMPDLDGTEVFERVKEHYGEKRAKFVAISASVLEHQRRQCLEAGFDGFIAKPFHAEEIYACLAQFLNAEYEYEETAEESPPDWSAAAVPTELLADFERALKTQNITALHGHIDALADLENFMRLLAGRIGQIVNLSSLANDVGVSSTTLKEWLSVLEASYVIFRLTPYFENLGKRVVKSLVLEALKARLNAGRENHLYFYRDRQSHEVDLLFQEERRLVPVEIKSAMTFHPDFVRDIERFQQMTPTATRGYVIYAGDLKPALANADVLHFADTSTIFNRSNQDGY